MEKSVHGHTRMRYYLYKQIHNWFSSAADRTPSITKIMLHLSISVALFSFSAIVLVIALTLAKQLLGLV